jgi:hypothetical protein
MSDILSLNCLVKGDIPHHIFSVEIAPPKTVGTLREAIKKEIQCRVKFPADELDLYHISEEVGTCCGV